MKKKQNHRILASNIRFKIGGSIIRVNKKGKKKTPAPAATDEIPTITETDTLPEEDGSPTPVETDETDTRTRADIVAEKELEQTQREMRLMYKIGTGLALAGAVGAEIVSHIITGRSLFLDIVNQTAEATRNVDAFQRFFTEHPIGKTVESTLEFISSKPTKRALRIILLATSFAAGTAATGGGLAIAGLVVTCSTVAIFSVREYLRERRALNAVKLNKTLFEFSTQLTETKDLYHSLSPALNKQLAEFIFQGVPKDQDPARKPVSPLKDLLKSIAVNALECSGALFSGDFREFVAIFGVGTMREFKFNQSHAMLGAELAKSNNHLSELASKACGLEQARYFANPEQALNAQKKEAFVANYVKEHKDELAKLPDDQVANTLRTIEEAYKAHIVQEELQAKEARASLPLHKKVIEQTKDIAHNKYVEHVLLYLKTWVPYKKYNPEKERCDIVSRGNALYASFSNNIKNPSKRELEAIKRVCPHVTEPVVTLQKKHIIRTNRSALEATAKATTPAPHAATRHKSNTMSRIAAK